MPVGILAKRYKLFLDCRALLAMVLAARGNSPPVSSRFEQVLYSLSKRERGMQHLFKIGSPHPYPFPVQGRERGTCSNFKAIGDNTFTPTQCGEHPVRRGPFIPYFPKFFLKTFIQLLFSSDLILYSVFCRILIRIQRRKIWLNNLIHKV